jgi:hypothetical protein
MLKHMQTHGGGGGGGPGVGGGGGGGNARVPATATVVGIPTMEVSESPYGKRKKTYLFITNSEAIYAFYSRASQEWDSQI